MYTLITSLLLASTALAAPATTSYPPPAKPKTCVERAGDSAWTVNNFDFHSSYIFTTPAHQNSYGYVNFTLTNTALDYKPVCSATSSQLQDFFYGTQTYTCQNPAKPANNGDVTTFTFDRTTGKLHIEQEWNCVKEGGRFNAKGGTTLNLKCDTKETQNPDWQQGEFYSTKTVTCKKVTQKAKIEELSGVL